MLNSFHIAALALTLAACSDPTALTIEITPGRETDAFEQDPPVTRLNVSVLDLAGAALLSTAADPGGGFTLGELPTDQLVRFEVRGTDANDDVQMRGRSLAFVLGALDADVFPVFVQRVDAWARPPGQLPHANVDGLAAVLGERFLILTGGEAVGGTATSVLFYDMLSLSGYVGGALTSVPKSMTVSADGRALIVIDDEDALWLNFDDGTELDLTAPEGLGAYANVAGGHAVRGPSANYIVGATRAGEPTDRILIINNNGTLAAARLNTPRARAAASWVDGVGLVIVGGAAEGAGVEVLADGETQAEDLAYAADPIIGAVAALGPADQQLLLLCGDDANGAVPARLIDLDCGTTCAPTVLSASVGGLTNCSAHKSGDRVIMTGHDDTGIMVGLLVDAIADTVAPLPLREERTGARVVAAPNGTLAIIGGKHLDGSPAVTVEMLFPSE